MPTSARRRSIGCGTHARRAGAARDRVRRSSLLNLDEEPLEYEWDFGGGRTGHGPTVSHTFNATLTVTDALGAPGTMTVRITVGNEPPQLIVSPPSLGGYTVGEQMEFEASTIDLEGGVLPNSAITFSSMQPHCPYLSQYPSHPGPIIGETRESDTRFCLIPGQGDESYLEVLVTAEDSREAVSTKLVNVPARFQAP